VPLFPKKLMMAVYTLVTISDPSCWYFIRNAIVEEIPNILLRCRDNTLQTSIFNLAKDSTEIIAFDVRR
jgi:hypothetical protein